MEVQNTASTAGTADALNEKDLYCIARHVRQHVKESKYNLKEDSFRACWGCRYALTRTCTDHPDWFDPWPSFGKLRRQTGVIISPLVKKSFMQNEDCEERQGI